MSESISEKQVEDEYSQCHPGRQPSPFKRRLIIVLCLFSIWMPTHWFLERRPIPLPQLENPWSQKPSKPQCQQAIPLFPVMKSKDLADMDAYIETEQFRNESVARLGGAVKIPTQSYDDMGPIGEDSRWDIFYQFSDYLKSQFPGVHFVLDLDVVNTHGLVYTWKGSNDTLKPLLFMAHQDVVPVPETTVGSWTYPPFSGAYDGKHVWGRGASDCKNSLIGILESVELLVKARFKPARTVVLSFGFDEEISGMEGAGHLAPYLVEKYGKDAFAAIVDEGAGVNTLWGTHFATPGVAEKGKIRTITTLIRGFV
jgi:Gly-Xaa carboxypeptidase